MIVGRNKRIQVSDNKLHTKITDTETIIDFDLRKNDKRIKATKATASVKNASGFLFEFEVEVVNGVARVDFSNEFLEQLTVDTYYIEFNVDEDGDRSIYPDEGFARFVVEQNTKNQDGDLVPQLTFDFVLSEAKKYIDEVVGDIEQGAKGDKGDRGEQGPQGEVGPKGDKGDTGPQGEMGLPGKDGATGAQGPEGKPGADGKDGTDGKDAPDNWNRVQTADDLTTMGIEPTLPVYQTNDKGSYDNSGMNIGQFVAVVEVYTVGGKTLFLNMTQESVVVSIMLQITNLNDYGNVVVYDLGNRFLMPDYPSPIQVGDDYYLSYDAYGLTWKKSAEVPDRLPPMNWVLDTSTKPWKIKFDNGMVLTLNDYGDNAAIYGYGHPVSLDDGKIAGQVIAANFIQAARGYITIDTFKAGSGSSFNYFSNNYTLKNSMNDSSKYDFTIATFGVADDKYNRQYVVIKMMYEMGIWTEAEIESLGAVKNQSRGIEILYPHVIVPGPVDDIKQR
ncbi:collagen-like protein [Weissella diestrammenae]|uniref:Collagen-like protein n=1 Tax=Weissella diestrammenae TaxID=1162633 RepID=A0A7G9T4Q0_9LACO|nr:collagen-like protein [Weissella diestrammenae]MCM0582782.1 collagen-like protein [Weissella diestrammenae]QNN75075.1 collagen-like protein [Weissella diestrammenae]